MLFYTVGQAQAFLIMAVGGLAAGLWYDAVRVACRALEAGRWMTALTDALFAAGCLGIVMAFLLAANFGEARIYCLLGFACGLILYRCTIHRLLLRVLGALFRAAKAAARRIYASKIVSKLWK